MSNFSIISAPDFSIEVSPLSTLELKSEPLTLQMGSSTEKLTLEVGTIFSGSQIGGIDSPTLDVEITVTQPMGVYRAATVLGAYCEPTTESLPKYAGVTKSAVIIGDRVKVVKSGLISESTWNWVVDTPIYIGVSGVLTQTQTNLPVRRIGYAITATQINLDVFPIIGA